MRVITNNIPRDLVDAYELTAEERTEFDYLDWPAIDAGTDSATFFRYRGNLYDLGEFTRDYGITKGSGLPEHLATWDGYLPESAFSAVVVRIVDDNHVVVGLILS